MQKNQLRVGCARRAAVIELLRRHRLLETRIVERDDDGCVETVQHPELVPDPWSESAFIQFLYDLAGEGVVARVEVVHSASTEEYVVSWTLR